MTFQLYTQEKAGAVIHWVVLKIHKTYVHSIWNTEQIPRCSVHFTRLNSSIQPLSKYTDTDFMAKSILASLNFNYLYQEPQAEKKSNTYRDSTS